MNILKTMLADMMADFERLSIPYGPVKDIRWSARMSRSRGNCKKTPDGFVIHISTRLKDHPDVLCSTIAHELLHTVPGCFNHGKKFKNCAERLRMAGHLVSVRYEPEPFETEGLMVFECTRCHKQTTRSRASAFTKHPERYRHQGCGGTFRKVSS